MSIGRKNQARYRARSSQAQANVKAQARPGQYNCYQAIPLSLVDFTNVEIVL